jgi:hypothetical protein
MKNIILIIGFILTPVIGSAQNLFDSVENLKEVNMVVITKDAYELLSKFNPEKFKDSEEIKAFEIISDLKEFRKFSTTNNLAASKMKELAEKIVKKQNLIQLMRFKEKDVRVKIYVKTTKSKVYVNSVLLFIEGVDEKIDEKLEAMLISLTGNIEMEKVSELANTFIKNNK